MNKLKKVFYNNDKFLTLKYIKCSYKLTRNTWAKGAVSS